MSLSVKKKIVISLLILLPVLIITSGFLYPPEIRYQSILNPVLVGDDPAYSIDEEINAFVLDIGGNC